VKRQWPGIIQDEAVLSNKPGRIALLTQSTRFAITDNSTKIMKLVGAGQAKHRRNEIGFARFRLRIKIS
jgi:hypothetical protein